MKSCGITSNGRPRRISPEGWAKEEARLAALRTFGNFVAVREQTHETWAWTTAGADMAGLPLRPPLGTARAVAFDVLPILALALGIGLNTGVFTMLNAMFLRAPTLVDPASFVQICPRYSGWFAGAHRECSFTTEDFDAIRSRSHALK